MSNTSVIELRSPNQVMRPEWMGAVRLTRYSFNRMLIRRAFADHWRIETLSVDLDAEGQGEVIMRVTIGESVFHFVALTVTIDESEHTDRVIAERWEITATLSEGELTDDLLSMLRTEVPLQEKGRLDHRVLVLTRGNRSVRFFQYLVDTLAAGNQPDPELVADAGYIMRSTAFYGNGKFGMRSFEGYEADHPLGAPYRAQMLCAWLFRELGYLVVEHCARVRGGDEAVPFNDEWSSYFGLGNATGLGLVPYAFRHPAIIAAWVRVRERALADVRAMPADASKQADLRWWIDRARRHFSTGTDDNCHPFLNGAALAPIVERIATQYETCCHDADGFDQLYRWAEADGPETAELVTSLLIELHDGVDTDVDEAYMVDEHAAVDPEMTVEELKDRLSAYAWMSDVDVDGDEADWFWWLISDNTNEPRRAPRQRLDPTHRDVAIDVALRVRRLLAELEQWDGDATVGAVLAASPEHRMAVHRAMGYQPYGEPHDNACARTYMPLMLQRFQLATYGMDNFKPKSTDWLRVTLYQGAPRVADLAAFVQDGGDLAEIDRWALPPRPTGPDREGRES